MLYQKQADGTLARVDSCCPDCEDILTQANAVLDEANNALGASGASGGTVISAPTFTLPATVSNLKATTTFTVGATAYLPDASISAYWLSIPELGINNQAFTSGSVSFTISPSVAAGTVLNVSVVAVDSFGNQSAATSRVTTVGTAVINAPSITVPVTNAEVDIKDGSILVQASAFSVSGAFGDSHAATDWQIATDAAFSNIVLRAENSSDLTSHTFPATSLTAGTTYYARGRYKGTAAGWGQWSASSAFKAVTHTVNAPSFTVPTYVSNFGSKIEFTASSSVTPSGSISRYIANVPVLGISNQASTNGVFSFNVPTTLAVGTAIVISVVAEDSHGHQSAATSKTVTVATGSIAQPTITVPVENAEVDLSSGTLSVQTSAFSSTGNIVQTHKSSDWQLANDNAFSSIIQQALGSADLLSHNFTSLSLDGGKTVYLRARHNGENVSSPWSNFRTISVKENKITIAEGRTIYRHGTLPGSVVEFYDVGTASNIKLLVLDASYAFQAAWAANSSSAPYNTNISGLTDVARNNASNSYYINGGNAFMTTTQGQAWTESQINLQYPANKCDNHTAAYNYDQWKAYPSSPIIQKLGQVSGYQLLVPNKQEAIRMYCSAIAIDELDPTVASYPNQTLTKWFNSGYMWTSSESENNPTCCALCVGYNGYIVGGYDKWDIYNYGGKDGTCWVRPVLELV